MKKNTPKKRAGVFLLSIGDEILDGRTQNTNASWIGEQLRLKGVPVAEVRAVSDRVEEIAAALRYGLRFPMMITTGGLGPTNDDRTMEAVSKAFKLPLGKTKSSLEHVRSRYEARGLGLNEARLKLAYVPRGGKVLANPKGTAPGVELKVKDTRLFILPGPPVECHPIFTKNVLPLTEKLKGKKLLHREFWRTFGKGESEIYGRVADFVSELEKKYPDTFTFGVHISFPCIDLTLESWAVKGKKSPSAAEIKAVSKKISAALGKLCFTRKRESLVEVVSQLLQKKNVTLSTAESCTGGLLAKMLTDISGCSACYFGGVVSYSNPSKEELLGVEKETLDTHGAVSEQTVKEMAEGVRRRLKTDYSLSLSGISGPDGGSPEKPVGTIYVGIANKQRSDFVHQVILGGKGSRDQNRIIAAFLALDLLRNALQE